MLEGFLPNSEHIKKDESVNTGYDVEMSVLSS